MSANPTRRRDVTDLLLILNLCLALSSVGLYALTLAQGLDWRGDFSAYYTGWVMIRDGQGAQLYDLQLQARYQQQILGDRSFADGLLPYLNPPHLTLPLVPLALVSRRTAYWLWSLLQVGLLIWLLRLLQRIACDWTRRERLLLVSAVCAFAPLARTFLLGTFSLWMTICIVQIYRALHQRHDVRAGLWLMLGTIKFQIVLLPAVMLLAGRRWRALASAALFGGALALLTTLVLGWQVWPGYIATMREVNTYFGKFGIVPRIMYNLRGTLALWLGYGQGPLINQISTALLIAAALLIVWLWRGPWTPAAPRFTSRMALTMLLSVLCNPNTNPHDGLVLVAPAVLFYDYLRRQGLPHRGFGAFALLCPLLFFLSDFVIDDRLGIRLPVILMLIFAFWIGQKLLHERRLSQS